MSGTTGRVAPAVLAHGEDLALVGGCNGVRVWCENPAIYDQDCAPPPSLTPLYALTPEEVRAVDKLRARKAWQTRQTNLCNCDHFEYCQHCWPESFRPGGVWHGLGA